MNIFVTGTECKPVEEILGDDIVDGHFDSHGKSIEKEQNVCSIVQNSIPKHLKEHKKCVKETGILICIRCTPVYIEHIKFERKKQPERNMPFVPYSKRLVRSGTKILSVQEYIDQTSK